MNNLFERPGFWRGAAGLVALLALGCFAGAVRTLAGSAVTPLAVSQVPLTVVIPAHPQIVIALGNSQSMDGDLSGAIYTGAGSLGAGNGMSLLYNSGSPVNYQVPGDFVPPLNAGSGGYAPYTVVSGGVRYDNSASRLNVAKAGITAILQAYAANADFALMNYATSGVGEYTTWVYYMSPAGSPFAFQSTPNPVTATNPTVANPCFNYKALSGATSVYQNCLAFDAHYYPACTAVTTTCGLNSMAYMVIGSSSDNAAISDVLYAGGLAPLCLDYGAVSPSNPFTYSYGRSSPLAAYVAGSVYVGYSAIINSCASSTGPTNAGYVPFSPEVMYVERGFGYYSSESASGGNLIVGMTSTGSTPTAAAVATVVSKFAPYLAPETDSTGTPEIKALAVQSPIAGIIKQSGTYLGGSLPTSDGCGAKQYVVLVTDGLPTQDLGGGNWPPLGSASGNAYGLSASFSATDGSLLSTNDQALNDAINQIATLRSRGIKTYVIGLGAGVADTTGTTMAAKTLTAMAVAGGTGAYFPAVSAGALVTDMQAILAAILGDVQSVGSVAVNSTGLNTNSVIFQSQFIPSTLYQDWTGDLFAYPIDPNSGQVTVSASSPQWSAATQLDAIPYTQRLIATWDPVAGHAIPFEWNASASTTGISTATTLGQQLQTFTPDPNGADVLAYLRGNVAQEQRNGGQFRNRTHILGDIVNSSPVYVGAAAGDSQDPAYRAFAATYASRGGTLFVGANDGMLHAFDASNGVERFAYIPQGVYSNLINLVNPYYGAVHRFYVNGSPQAADARFSDGTWHTIVVSGEAQGGNTVFALDVTNPAAITTETQLAAAVLWEFSDPDMGLSYSNPAVANTAAGYAVMFGNGYNSPGQKPILYAVDPKSGAVIAKIDLCAQQSSACNAALANGLSSVSIVNDGGAIAGPDNVVYAGDLQGNLWRVDISSTNPGSWSATVLFQARDASGNPQPIIDPPAVTLNPRYPQLKGTMVFFGTGQLFGVSDLGTTQVQSIYGVYDNGGASATPLNRSSLVRQTITQATATFGGSSVLARFVTTTQPVTLPSNRGWYIDLNLLAGERVITVPAVVPGGELVVTSYVPSSNLCTGGGESFVMVINYATGGSFTAPQFDISGAGFPLGGSDSSGGQNPVGMLVGGYYAASPMIRSTGQGDMLYLNGAPQACPQGTTCYVAPPNGTALRGASSSRTFWWEMR